MNVAARWLVGGIAGLALLGGPDASGATFTVATGDLAALKAAINTANANGEDDTINLAADGSYFITAPDNSDNGLPIITADGGHPVTINGNGATITCVTSTNVPVLRAFNLIGNVTMNNLTIAKGRASDGGAAIKNAGGTLTLQGCTFTGGTAFLASQGGAISNDTGMVNITDCVFTNNKAFYSSASGASTGAGGGAIFNSTGNITITRCLFSGNSAPDASGGAIFNGGVFNTPPSTLATMTVDGCTFTGNTAARAGGAIINGAPLAIRNSLLSGNSVSRQGTADNNGGAVYNVSDNLFIANCTFCNNTALDAQSSGGGLYNAAPTSTRNASATLRSCTFSGNDATLGSDIATESQYTTSSANVGLGNTILGGGSHSVSLSATGGGIANIGSYGFNLSKDGAGGMLAVATDRVNLDPLFDPAGLQDNGGPTQTLALTSNSPAIDKGRSTGVTTDQRGKARPVDFPAYTNASGGDGSDIGAYEADDFVQTGSPLLVTTLADHDDGTAGGTDCTLREAVRRARQYPSVVRNIVFGAGTLNGTMVLTGGEILTAGNFSITGPGARLLAISGNQASRVFNVSTGILTVSGLTIRDGLAAGTAGVAGQGGGIYIGTASLVLHDCALVANRANGGSRLGSNGSAGQGGAIYAAGFATMDGCTFSGNSATGASGTVFLGSGSSGGAGQGGAIYNAGTFMTLTSCTVSGGTAKGGNGATPGGSGGAANGGGIYNTGAVTLTGCTVSGNTGTGGSGAKGASSGAGTGGIANVGGTAKVASTICAGNTGTNDGGADVNGEFTSLGYNLIGSADHSTGFPAAGDLAGTGAAPVNPLLVEPLANTGGSTDTFSLAANSPAINAGSDTISPHRDQRGYLRTGRPDIGAFESDGSLLRLVSYARSGTDMVLRVEVVKGKVYRLERKLNLTDAAWQSVPDGFDQTATGNDIELFRDYGVTGTPRAFYQVRWLR